MQILREISLKDSKFGELEQFSQTVNYLNLIAELLKFKKKVFDISKPQNLISRKISVIDRFLNFHIVNIAVPFLSSNP